MIDVNSVPSDLLKKIRQQFDNDPQVQRLRIQQRMKQDSGDYMGALGMGQSIEELYSRVVQNYLDETERQVKKVDVLNLDIPSEEKDRIMMLAIVMFMACDIIASAILDIDDTIHKYDKDLHFEMFNDIKQLSEMAQDKLSFLNKNSNFMKDEIWADKCDNMYEIMQSKVRSVIRKNKTDKNWGKNQEKYNKNG